MSTHKIKVHARDQAEGPAAAGWSYRPRIDVTENAEEYTVLLDMAGVAPKAIRIDRNERIVHVHGTVKPRQPRALEFDVHEYGVGDFDREFAVPDTVELDRISAEHDHGVLTIHLPRAEQSRPRRIEVRTV
jgi:HSP20 family protein